MNWCICVARRLTKLVGLSLVGDWCCTHYLCSDNATEDAYMTTQYCLFTGPTNLQNEEKFIAFFRYVYASQGMTCISELCRAHCLYTPSTSFCVSWQSAELSKEREHLASLASQLAEKSKSLSDQEQRLSAANAEVAAARAHVANTEAAAKEKLAAGMCSSLLAVTSRLFCSWSSSSCLHSLLINSLYFQVIGAVGISLCYRPHSMQYISSYLTDADVTSGMKAMHQTRNASMQPTGWQCLAACALLMLLQSCHISLCCSFPPGTAQLEEATEQMAAAVAKLRAAEDWGERLKAEDDELNRCRIALEKREVEVSSSGGVML